MKPTVTFTGVAALDKKLNRIGKRDASRIGRKAGRRGVAHLAKEIKKEAPVKTKALKKSVGSRFKKRRTTGVIRAIAGVGVGKKRQDQTRYGHMVAMQTGFVDRANNKASREAMMIVRRTVSDEIKKLK